MSKLVRNVATPRAPWTSQPQVPIGIDWSNPITKGLSSCFIPTSEVEIITGAKDVSVSTKNPDKVFQKGKAFVTTNADTASIIFSVKGFSTAPITVFALASITDNTSAGEIYAYGANTTYHTTIRKVGNVFGAVSNSNSGTPTVGSVVAELGRPYSLVVTDPYTTNSFSLYVDGIIDGSPNTTGNRVSSSSSGISYAGSMYQASAARGVNLFLGLSWTRILSDAEIKSISDNPWQIFLPIIRGIPFEVIRGASTVRSSYMMGTTNPELSLTSLIPINTKVSPSSQPQTPIGIDWSNPITKGLAEVFVNGFEYISGKPSNSTQRGIRPAGRVESATGVYNTKFDTADQTIIGHFSMSSDNVDYNGLLYGYYGSAVDAAQFGVSFANGNVMWINRANGGGSPISGAYSLNTDNIYAMAGTMNSGNPATCYINGKEVYSCAQSGVGAFTLDTRKVFRKATSPAKMSAWAYRFTRVLSPAEIASLSNNPWQIFLPATKQIWVPAL